MWTAIKLLASGALKWLLSGLSAFFGWCREDWTRFPFVAFFVAFNVLVWFKIPAIERERDDLNRLWVAEQDAHRETVQNYEAAATTAQREADQNKARVEAEWRAINQEEARDFQTRIADLRDQRDRLVRLRQASAAGADPRLSGAASQPAAANSGRADAASAHPQFPASGPTGRDPLAAVGDPAWSLSPQELCPVDRVCLTFEEALIASEQAVQLDSLISVIERWAEVPVDAEGGDDAGQ